MLDAICNNGKIVESASRICCSRSKGNGRTVIASANLNGAVNEFKTDSSRLSNSNSGVAIAPKPPNNVVSCG